MIDTTLTNGGSFIGVFSIVDMADTTSNMAADLCFRVVCSKQAFFYPETTT